jgi:hypothetical protein
MIMYMSNHALNTGNTFMIRLSKILLPYLVCTGVTVPEIYNYTTKVC